MGKSGVSWTAYKNAEQVEVPGLTFNPWIGCDPVSPACNNCYMGRDVHLHYPKEHLWKKGSTRRQLSELYWEKPHAWERKAIKEGTRPRVFCASWADVFERHMIRGADGQPYDELKPMRDRLFALIEATPHLDWLLLTKRIGNVAGMVPAHWMSGSWPTHAWMGASMENQFWANVRMPILINLPATIHFVSGEPLLGYVHLRTAALARGWDYLHEDVRYRLKHMGIGSVLEWVITGGESGPEEVIRPSDPAWFRLLQRECARAQHPIPFFFKQWGGVTHNAGGDLLDEKQYHDAPTVAIKACCYCHREFAGEWRHWAHESHCTANQW